ncbi:hypothetical protein D3C86_1102450 [compost metagenome]
MSQPVPDGQYSFALLWSQDERFVSVRCYYVRWIGNVVSDLVAVTPVNNPTEPSFTLRGFIDPIHYELLFQPSVVVEHYLTLDVFRQPRLVEWVKPHHYHTSYHVTTRLVFILGTAELNALDLREFNASFTELFSLTL